MGIISNRISILVLALVGMLFISGCFQQPQPVTPEQQPDDKEEIKRSASKEINNAIIEINAAEDNGKDTADARKKLESANAVFINGDYELAFQLAGKARALAADAESGTNAQETDNKEPPREPQNPPSLPSDGTQANNSLPQRSLPGTTGTRDSNTTPQPGGTSTPVPSSPPTSQPPMPSSDTSSDTSDLPPLPQD